MKRILDYDPMTGITTYFDYIPESDMTVIYREQDVEPILEANKRLQNDNEITRDGIKNGWWHYFQMPNIVIEQWLNEYGLNVYDKNHWPDVFKRINDPQWKWLKTTSKMHTVR